LLEKRARARGEGHRSRAILSYGEMEKGLFGSLAPARPQIGLAGQVCALGREERTGGRIAIAVESRSGSPSELRWDARRWRWGSTLKDAGRAASVETYVTCSRHGKSEA
jgi:hypothetical protein